MTSKARTLLGKGRRRISRTFSTDEERGVTAEHWGEDAREKAESEDWQGLYWQSYILTAQHINRDISGDPAVDWLTFTKQRFFPKAAELALSLGCGYGIVERDGYRARDRTPLRGLRHLARGGRGRGGRSREGRHRRPDRLRAADLNTIELEPGRYDAVFVAQTLHHIEALEHLLDQIHGSLTEDGLFVVNEYVGPRRFQFPDDTYRS